MSVSAKSSCAKRVNRFYAVLQIAGLFAFAAHVRSLYTALLGSRHSYFRSHLKTIALVVLSVSAAHAEDQITALNRAERYLNSISTLTADFVQVAPNGEVAEGKLYLQRPGKMRWEYKPPTPILMVSDGDTFVYHDTEMDEVTYLDLDDTLAAFIAKPEINFADDDLRVINLREGAGSLRFTVLQTERPDEGTLTMVFRTAPLRLHQLIVIDGAGEPTQMTFENVQLGQPIDKEKFIFRRSMLDRRR